MQPVVARLDDTPQIKMQQGMLRTFGRVMPILLPLTTVLILVTAVLAPAGAPRLLWVIAAVAAVIMIAFTLTINVPINKRTLTWDPEHPPQGWRTDRRRWRTYQGVRALLLGVWFLCAAVRSPLHDQVSGPRPLGTAAYCQKAGIHSGGVGLSVATWVSKIAIVPVDGVMWAEVPVPPTQPYRPSTFHGSMGAMSTEPPKPQP